MTDIQPRTILVVDDTEANRYTLARHLRRAGYAVREAASGEAALQEARKHPDLIILDVKLPDLSGYEVSRLVRQDPETCLIPILQISANFTMSSDRVKGLDAGADGYLTGPVQPEELLANVRMLLRLKQAQDALSRTNERLKAVISNIVDVFFALDYQYRFVELNRVAEQLLGRPADQLVGKSILEEFPAISGSQVVDAFRQAAADRKAVHFEGPSSLHPGIWWEAHIYPLEYQIDIYLRDITDRKLDEQRLAEAADQLRTHVQQLQVTQRELASTRDQLKLQNEVLEQRVRERTAKLQETITDLETFSYSITHDMRAPLRAMQGFSKILLESHGPELEPEAVDFLHRISNSANRLDMLIRDVLSYSNIIRSELQLVPVDADKLLRDILREYPGLQPPQASVDIQGRLPVVLANEAFLTQCFSNLLSNAIKFVAEGTRPRVEVSAEQMDGFVRLKFKDNGIGIPPQHQRHLFTLFHRAQNKYPGTGIGLAVVQKAVERMGGKAGVESDAGKGSTFWVELKVAAPATP